MTSKLPRDKTEDQKAIAAIKSDMKGRAEWVGEDGNMACLATTKLGALRKFKALMRSDVGDGEAEELGLGLIGTGFIHLPDRRDADEIGCSCVCHNADNPDREKNKFGCKEICYNEHNPSDEHEWYISRSRPKKRPYLKAYWYQG